MPTGSEHGADPYLVLFQIIPNVQLLDADGSGVLYPALENGAIPGTVFLGGEVGMGDSRLGETQLRDVNLVVLAILVSL